MVSKKLPQSPKFSQTILGLDILPGHRQNPSYAAVILDKNGKKIFEGEITRFEIFNILKKYNVSTIAIDNIFELFPSSNEIIDFLRKTRIKLLQVTGPLGKEMKLSYLASLYGLSRKGKLSPHIAAEIAARLALLGVGAEIKIFEDITEILITRTRSLGEGGQHQTKYARVIASVIQRAAREIEDILRDSNLQYDFFAREGDFGIKSAKFIVYAPYDTVKRVVSKYQGDLFRIDVRPLEKEKIAFLPTDKSPASKRLLICGIDPGETTGLAILDLSGNILYVGSKKNYGLISLLETIYEFGKPVLIASDVPKVPQFIEKMCRKIGALCHTPSHIYSVGEKNELIRQINVRVSNSHERDALVAAIIAYNKYKSTFQKIDNLLSYIPLKLDADAIKKEVLYGASIKDAIHKHFEKALTELLRSSMRPSDSTQVKHIDKKLIIEKERLNKRLSEALQRINELEKRIENLEKQIREKDLEISRLNNIIEKQRLLWKRNIRSELERIKDSYIRDLETRVREYKRIINAQRRKISTLEERINNLLTLLRKTENEIAVKKLIKFDNRSIETLDKTYGILRGDIIYIEDPSGGGKNTALQLSKRGILAIVVREKRFSSDAERIFNENNIPILLLDDFDPPLVLKGDITIISREAYETALKNMKLRELPEDEALYMEVESILAEWREKRLKELNEEN